MTFGPLMGLNWIVIWEPGTRLLGWITGSSGAFPGLQPTTACAMTEVSGCSTGVTRLKTTSGMRPRARRISLANPTLVFLKVSFFGPFYGSYIVFELDKENYQHAFVSGPNTSYLWLLARTPSVSQEVMDRFVSMSAERGFNTDELIMVEQELTE